MGTTADSSGPKARLIWDPSGIPSWPPIGRPRTGSSDLSRDSPLDRV